MKINALLAIGSVVVVFAFLSSPAADNPESDPAHTSTAQNEAGDLKLAHFEFKNRPLEEVLVRIAAEWHYNLVVNWGNEGLGDQSVGPATPFTLEASDVSPHDALATLFQGGVNWEVTNGTISVGVLNRGDAWPLRVYGVRDLIDDSAQYLRSTGALGADASPADARDAAADRLAKLIADRLNASDNWREARNLKEFAGRFLITASVSGHRKVEELLRELRRAGHPTSR